MLDTDHPRRAADYQAEIMDGELVIFNPVSERVLHSNDSGALIWQLCDGQRSVADIIRLLAEAYPDSAGQIQADVRATLQTFAENGVVELI
jgi:coenzyme PQQ biosynthesis protein PqqD